MRVAVGLIFAALLGYYMVVFGLERRQAKAYESERAQSLADPLIAPLIAAGTAQCRSPVQSSSYVWACGATLRINGPTQGDLCSTEDSPRYTGELVEGGFGVGYSAIWSGLFKEPLSDMIRCEGPEGQIDPACIRLDIYGDTGFGAPAGQTLAADLIEPDFNKPGNRFGEYEAWTALNGLDVRHGFKVFIGGGSQGKPPPHACSLTARHPQLPLTVNLAFPCERRAEWKAILEDAFLGLERSVIRFDENTQCDAPPEGVRFTINTFSTHVDVLRDWASQKAQTGQP